MIKFIRKNDNFVILFDFRISKFVGVNDSFIIFTRFKNFKVYKMWNNKIHLLKKMIISLFLISKWM